MKGKVSRYRAGFFHHAIKSNKAATPFSILTQNRSQLDKELKSLSNGIYHSLPTGEFVWILNIGSFNMYLKVMTKICSNPFIRFSHKFFSNQSWSFSRSFDEGCREVVPFRSIFTWHLFPWKKSKNLVLSLVLSIELATVQILSSMQPKM